MDGVIGDEWAGAVTFPLHDDAGQPVEGARFLIMNDMDNLYVGLTVTEQPGKDLLDVRFDNDADGVLEEDEDELIVLGPGIVTDQRLIDANATLGDYCCWGYWDAQQDGGAAVGVSEQLVTYEAWHPLNSGDGQDFAVRGGAVIGVCALYYDAPVFVLRQTPSRCGYGGMDLSGFLQYQVSQPTVEEVVDQLVAAIGGLLAAGEIPPPAGLGLLPIATAAQGRLAAGHAVACRSLLNAFIARLEMAAAAGQLIISYSRKDMHNEASSQDNRTYTAYAVMCELNSREFRKRLTLFPDGQQYHVALATGIIGAENARRVEETPAAVVENGRSFVEKLLGIAGQGQDDAFRHVLETCLVETMKDELRYCCSNCMNFHACLDMEYMPIGDRFRRRVEGKDTDGLKKETTRCVNEALQRTPHIGSDRAHLLR